MPLAMQPLQWGYRRCWRYL